jgi:hypothetical protein
MLCGTRLPKIPSPPAYLELETEVPPKLFQGLARLHGVTLWEAIVFKRFATLVALIQLDPIDRASLCLQNGSPGYN